MTMEGQMKLWLGLCLSVGFMAAAARAEEPQPVPRKTSLGPVYGASISISADEPPPASPKKGTLPAAKDDAPAVKKGGLPAAAPETQQPHDECVDMWCPGMCCPYPPGRVWSGADFLLWWTRGDRLPPLLTTTP